MRNRIQHMFVFLPWLTFWSQASNQLADKSFLSIGLTHTSCSKIEKKIKAQIARTPQSRAQGLGGRSTPLSPAEGMLFIFDSPDTVSFWMKNTLIPLEIAFFDASGSLLNTMKMAVEKNPNEPKVFYTSKGKASLALETAPNTLAPMKPLLPSPLKLCVDSLPSGG